MTAVVEARSLVADIAGPLRLGENVKAALARVARATGLNERRVRGLWNGEARLVASDEMDALRRVAARARADQHLQALAHADRQAVLDRLAAIDAADRLHDTHQAGSHHPA